MSAFHHIYYAQGALLGALSGSFFVHCFDTNAARRFSDTNSKSGIQAIKSYLVSYLPVGIGVVPMRAISFGVYSLNQELFFYAGFGLLLTKALAAMVSGLSLALLSSPAEVLKTRKQLELKKKDFSFLYESKKCFVPLMWRVVPTVMFMLAGTEVIKLFLPFHNLVIGTAIASMIAAVLSQILGTPSENIRIYRIQSQDYHSPVKNIIKQLSLPKLFIGFWARSISLGIQAAFSLTAALWMAGRYA